MRIQIYLCLEIVLNSRSLFLDLIEPTPQAMQFQQVPLYCPINPQGIIQAAGVGPPQNIMGPPGTPSTGPVTPGSQSFYYQNVFQGQLRFFPRKYKIF